MQLLLVSPGGSPFFLRFLFLFLFLPFSFSNFFILVKKKKKKYLAFTIVETMDPFSEMTIPLGLLLIGSSVIDGLSSVGL